MREKYCLFAEKIEVRGGAIGHNLYVGEIKL